MSSLICDYLLSLDGMKKTILSRQNSAYTTMRLLGEIWHLHLAVTTKSYLCQKLDNFPNFCKL